MLRQEAEKQPKQFVCNPWYITKCVLSGSPNLQHCLLYIQYAIAVLSDLLIGKEK